MQSGWLQYLSASQSFFKLSKDQYNLRCFNIQHDHFLIIFRHYFKQKNICNLKKFLQGFVLAFANVNARLLWLGK